MTNIVVFEDNVTTYNDIERTLEGTSHNVLEWAHSLEGMYELLGQIALKKIIAQVALVDGTLASSRQEREAFRFTPAGYELPPRPKLLGVIPRSLLPNPHEIIVEPEPRGQIGRDGRQIIRSLRALRSGLITIGISGDSMTEGVEADAQPDYDLTKNGINRLPHLLDQIERTRVR